MATAPDDVQQLVAFRVGEGYYALDIMRIKEIINPVAVTAVPKAPPFIEGVVELRGAIVPVVDLRKRLDVPATPIARTTKFMVAVIDVGGVRMVVALIVDGVLEPIRVAAEHLRPAPRLTQGEVAYFSGVVHYRRGGMRRGEHRSGGEAQAIRLERRRAAARGAASPEEPTRRSEDLIMMVMDIDALLSSSEKVTLQTLGGV